MEKKGKNEMSLMALYADSETGGEEVNTEPLHIFCRVWLNYDKSRTSRESGSFSYLGTIFYLVKN